MLLEGACVVGGSITGQSYDRRRAQRGLASSQRRSRRRGAEAVVGDLDRPETLPPALDAVERVFLITPMDLQGGAGDSAVVKAARAAGVRHLVKLHGAVRHAGDLLDQ